MPKHDETPDDEFNAVIDDLIACGELVEVSPGQLSLTPLGKRRAQALLDSLSTPQATHSGGEVGR